MNVRLPPYFSPRPPATSRFPLFFCNATHIAPRARAQHPYNPINSTFSHLFSYRHFTFQQLSTFPRILINNWISQNFQVFDLAWPLTAFWPYAVFFANLFLRCYSGHIFAHISLNTRPRKMRGSRFPWATKIYARAAFVLLFYIYRRYTIF